MEKNVHAVQPSLLLPICLSFSVRHFESKSDSVIPTHVGVFRWVVGEAPARMLRMWNAFEPVGVVGQDVVALEGTSISRSLRKELERIARRMTKIKVPKCYGQKVFSLVRPLLEPGFNVQLLKSFRQRVRAFEEES